MVILENIGAKPLLSWLQRFAVKKPLDATLSVDSMELDMFSTAVLLCEVLAMFYDGKPPLLVIALCVASGAALVLLVSSRQACPHLLLQVIARISMRMKCIRSSSCPC